MKSTVIALLSVGLLCAVDDWRVYGSTCGQVALSMLLVAVLVAGVMTTEIRTLQRELQCSRGCYDHVAKDNAHLRNLLGLPVTWKRDTDGS